MKIHISGGYIIKTFIGTCLIIFLSLSVCPADEDTNENVCKEWNDTPWSKDVCLVDEDTDKNNCYLLWQDHQRVCLGYKPEPKATPGSKIVDTGNYIIAKGVCGKGYCWDFVNAVFECAGYEEKNLKNIFSPDNGCNCDPCNNKEKETTRYLQEKDRDLIQPGYWIMFCNKEYHNNDHSAIFVCWRDKNKKNWEAGMLDFRGGNKRWAAGKKSTHDLKGVVYCIKRPLVKDNDYNR